MRKYDYLIVGSGITGAAFAHEMAAAGKRCLVLEKRDHIGGNVHDAEQNGILVHRYGAHIFHTSNRMVWEYLQQFTTFNHYINCPVANYHGEIYNLPFNMNTFSRLWGISTPEQAAEILEQQRQTYDRPPRNLEEQGLSLAGRDIFEKLIRGYTEKQWGRPCSELPAFILKRVPFRFTYDNNYFDDPYQGIPAEGYSVMIRRMLEGCEVLTCVDYLQDKAHYDSLAEKVFYTGMLDAYFGFSEGHLAYRSLRFEDEIYDLPNYQGVAVMNYTDAETPYTRSIEHKHFLFGRQPGTIVTREYPVEWEPGLEPYYPVNDEKNQALFGRYRSLAMKEERVIFAGRLGQYRYYDMDQAADAALKLARQELEQVS